MEKSVFNLYSSMKWLFPEYDFQTIDVENHKWVIIERVLEKGSWDEARWLFDTYGEQLVAEWVREHGFRQLSRRSFALWRLTLGIGDFQAPEWAIAAKEGNEW
jgi:hypothetical protein